MEYDKFGIWFFNFQLIYRKLILMFICGYKVLQRMKKEGIEINFLFF